jgi:hypothetical protein
MKLSKIFASTVVLLALLVLLGIGAPQLKAQNHPAYLHALSDLRLYRYLLDRASPNPVFDAERQHAIAEIDAAIREIKAASIEEGKNINFHPPADAELTPGNRYRKAREAGNAAWADINREEDNGYAHGLKHRALNHIEEANHTIDHIIRALEKQRM